MKKLFTSAIGLTVFVVFCIPVFSFNVFAKSYNLNYANFPPASTFPCVQMERWKKEVEKRTNGAVKINTFPGGTLLGAKGMMDGVIAGQADIGNLCMAYQPGRFVITNAVSLPLNIRDSKTGSLALLDLYDRLKPEAFKKVKVLAMFTTAPSNIMSKKPVRNLNDLKGMNLRASGGAAQILKIWGANQIGMPMSATPEALQKGVVQGLFSSVEVMKDFNFAEDCKYVTLTQTAVYPFAVVMNLSKWNKLPENVQKVMDDLVREQSEWTGNYMDNHVKEAMQYSKEKQGVEFITLAKTEQSKWNTKLAPVVDDWIVKAKAKNIDGDNIVKVLEELINKHKN